MHRATVVLKRLLAAVLVACLVVGGVGPIGATSAGAAPVSSGAAAQTQFDVQAFLDRQPGALKGYTEGRYRAAQVIEGYGVYYNLDPRVILTLLELVPNLLTDPNPGPERLRQPFGAEGPNGFTVQIDWAAREVRAGFGPYTKAPDVRFSDGATATLDLAQEPSVLAVQRFLARGRTQAEWTALKDQYTPLFRQLFGAEPAAVTPTPTPSAARPFLGLPWPAVYPAVPGDPLAGQPIRMIHSSYFDHVYPTVDRGRGSDGNDYIVTYQNRGAVSYNSHDGNDFYFPDRPIGTPIVAAADGVAYALTAGGNGVVIRHGGAYAGYETIYWHLNAFDQKFAGKIDTGVGVPVRAGEYLGVSGKSGFVIGGGHLHFEVRHNGKQVDPYGWEGEGPDPCAAWVAGCEASVWLWNDSLRGMYDFTPADAPAPPDTEAPVGTLTLRQDDDPTLLLPFDESPVQRIGSGAPMIATAAGGDLTYEEGVFGRAVRVSGDVGLTYPISGNLNLQSGSLSFWANLPAEYPVNGTGRHYLVAASNNPGDVATGIYTGTLALRREQSAEGPRWNFWTVDNAGRRHDLVAPDTLQPGWHQFVVTWADSGQGRSEKRLFVDGMLVTSAAEVAFPDFVGERLEIGRWTQAYGAAGAAFDEFAAYDRPLGDAHVRALAEQRDPRTGLNGPLGQASATPGRTIVLDANAIDRQGGVVGVRVRRDDEAWSEPLPYYDSYRWAISGTTGLHTFGIEYRDRADNVSVVTTTVTLASLPAGTAEIARTDDDDATLRLGSPGGAAPMVQLSASADFADATWQPWQAEVPWTWQPGRPRVVYVRFQSVPGLAGPRLILGPDAKRLFIPLTGQR